MCGEIRKGKAQLKRPKEVLKEFWCLRCGCTWDVTNLDDTKSGKKDDGPKKTFRVLSEGNKKGHA